MWGKQKMFTIEQDITLYSNRKKRIAKPIGLAISLKTCVRSKELITILNKLGHCISYDDVLRIVTPQIFRVLEHTCVYFHFCSSWCHQI